MVEKMIVKPVDVSAEAWSIMKNVFDNYMENESKYFSDFESLPFSEADLVKYCQELDDAGFVFFTNEPDDRIIYMLPTVLGLVSR